MTTDIPQAGYTLGFLLADVVRSARRDFSSRAQGLQLTPAIARLLYYIHLEPGSRQSDLAHRLEVTPVTLGRMLDRLVEQGYVRRVADSGDRRALRVYVDEAGLPVVDRVQEIRRLTEERALTGLSAAERSTLLSLLNRLRGNLAERGG